MSFGSLVFKPPLSCTHYWLALAVPVQHASYFSTYFLWGTLNYRKSLSVPVSGVDASEPLTFKWNETAEFLTGTEWWNSC